MLEPKPGGPPDDPPGLKARAGTISFQDFTDATLASINKAIVSAPDKNHPLYRNPIITIGIIWRPDWNMPDVQTGPR